MFETFKEVLQREHPALADRLLLALNTPAPVSVRGNPAKFNPGLHHFPAPPDRPVPWEPSAFWLQERPVFTLDPLFHAGGYYVQEASSMRLGEVVRWLRSTILTDKQPLKVLDLCGAPGGKSTHLASVLGADDLLVSNEIHRGRVQILTENMIKWGLPNVVVTSNNPSHFQSLGSWFDLIVTDAPCSGEGLFRKDPDAIRHWSPDAVQQCALRQNDILQDVWPALKPGGVLIYSTCTYNRSENEDPVARMVQSFGAQPLRPELSEFDSELIAAHESGAVVFRCVPGISAGEGFTFSVLQKSINAEVHYGARRGRGSLKRTKSHPRAGALDEGTAAVFLENAQRTFAVPEPLADQVLAVDDALHIHHAGTELGDDRRPAQSLAMSVWRRSGAFDEVELDTKLALDYLRREAVAVDSSLHGTVLVVWQGLGLGFAKATRGRLNNHYPQEWRIRMR